MDGQRIRILREQRGYTQEELANLIGVAYQQIWRWESGKNVPSGDMVQEIAKLFDVSADYVLGLVDEPHAHLTEADLSPIERKLIAAVRSGQFVEALEVFTALSKRMDKPQVSGEKPVVERKPA